MKYIPIILLFLCSCTAPRMIVPVNYEDQLIITKRYIGDACYSEKGEKYTLIITTFESVTICGVVTVPEGAHCYIRTVPCYQDVHPQIKAKLERKYFSWNGIEYRVKTW